MTEVTELIKEYEQQETIKELVQRFGIHRLTVTLWSAGNGPPVPVEVIATSLPRVVVKGWKACRRRAAHSGMVRLWVLLVDAKEAKVRQRHSLAHELAHVIWHPLSAQALPIRSEGRPVSGLRRPAITSRPAC